MFPFFQKAEVIEIILTEKKKKKKIWYFICQVLYSQTNWINVFIWCHFKRLEAQLSVLNHTKKFTKLF